MLSFWGSWSGMPTAVHDREIALRLKDQPFALVGVNSDTDKAKAKAAAEEAIISWRSFWCGEKGKDGAIPITWNIRNWPTVYILDHKGVIRAKQATGPEIDRIIDRLISEMD